jgi:hypothetical protein
MNFDGLKDSITKMLGGQRCKIFTRKFQNDMTNINSEDDVMTLLVHLGYLAYNSNREEVFIPNQEIADEFMNAVEDSKWENISKALRESEDLLEKTLLGEEEAVAKAIDGIHSENTSILSYNDENSLSCVITIAYYTARKDYTLIRELPTGKGFADVVFIPRCNKEIPAIIIELKWDQSAIGAINQIKTKKYEGALMEYFNNLLLVGINYNKKSKEHECVIEKYLV